jgi:hypothetical protein
MTFPPPGGTPDPFQPPQPYAPPADPTAELLGGDGPPPSGAVPGMPATFGQTGAPEASSQIGAAPDAYGQPGAAPNAYGQPGAPSAAYGQPSGVPSPYGQPAGFGSAGEFGPHAYTPSGTYEQPGEMPPGYGQPYAGYGAPMYAPTTNTLAILSLVFAFVFPIAGIVMGHVAKRQIRETGEQGDGLATAGLWLSYAFTALGLIFCVGYLGLALFAIGSGVADSGGTF